LDDGLTIDRVETLPLDLGELVSASLHENFRAVQRLCEDWDHGSNRFAGHGEALFEARLNGQLVAICGLNRDPYAADTVGRLRRLYVVPSRRLRGIGKTLVRVVLAHAGTNFRTVRLRTNRPDADRFYLELGFERIAQTDEATHQMQLKGFTPAAG
jgi:GNAT superfamily N-acetyltransferase